MTAICFIIVLLLFLLVFFLKGGKYTAKFDDKIYEHYSSLGFDVLSIQNPKKFDIKNPFLIETNAPVIIVEGLGVFGSPETIVKKIAVLKEGKTLIVWVRVTLRNKSISFESQPNIEQG